MSALNCQSPEPCAPSQERIFRAQVEDRPQPGRIADAAAVGVHVVQRIAELAALLKVEIAHLIDQKAAHQHLGLLAVQMVMIVGVRQVAGDRREERRLGPADLAFGSARRTDEERDVVLLGTVLCVAAPDVRRIRSAPEALRDVERKVGLPAGVVQIVLVEMDCAVLFGPLGPADGLRGPVPALHGARRQVDDLAIQAERTDVHDARCRHFPGEVPGADQVAPDRLRHRPQQDSVQLCDLQRPTDQGRRIELAVVMQGDRTVGHPCPSHDQRRRAGLGRDRHGLGDDRLVVGVRMARERPLDEGDRAPRLVEGRSGEIPAALLHRSTAAHRYLAAARVASHEGDAAVLDLEREARPRRRVAPHDQPLSTLSRRGRPDHRYDREAGELAQPWMVRHDGVGAGVDRLCAPRILARYRRGHRLEPEARPCGIGVAMDDAHDLGAVALGLAAHHEAHGLARRDAELVAIAQNL